MSSLCKTVFKYENAAYEKVIEVENRINELPKYPAALMRMVTQIIPIANTIFSMVPYAEALNQLELSSEMLKEFKEKVTHNRNASTFALVHAAGIGVAHTVGLITLSNFYVSFFMASLLTSLANHVFHNYAFTKLEGMETSS